MRLIGYTRVSSREQADSRAGLQAQRGAIMAECLHRRAELVEIYEDAASSGATMKRREGLALALTALKGGEADGIIVSKLDRLSRSLLDFAHLMERARKEGWNLVALDLGVDLSTPAGEFMANVIISIAQWERRIIGDRTRDALAVKKSQGVKLGRPSCLPVEVKRRILAERGAGVPLGRIAEGLNDDGIPCGQRGVKWYPSSVRAVYLAA